MSIPQVWQVCHFFPITELDILILKKKIKLIISTLVIFSDNLLKKTARYGKKKFLIH